MKKNLLTIGVILSLVCITLSFTKIVAAEKDLSNSDITNFINVLISIGAIAQDKVPAANNVVSQLSGSEETTTQTCSESDGGLNYNVKGNLTGGSNSCATGICYDSCYNGQTYTSGPGFAVSEWYCEDNTAKNKVENCSGGCIDGACIVPATKPLTAYVSCVANPSRAPIGSAINWSAIVYGGVGTYTYTWSDSEGSSGIASGAEGQTVTKTYTTAGIKTATLLVNDSEDNNATIRCNTSIYNPQSQSPVTPLTVSCFSDRTTVYLGPKDLPPITKGGNIVFTARTSGGNGGYTYLWSDTDGDEGLAGENLLKVYTTPGNKSMNVKVTSGTQTATAKCDFNVVDTPPPPLTVSCSGVKTSSDTVKWSVLASGGGLTSDGTENYAYLWWLPDAQNSVLTAEKSVSKVYTTTGTTIANLKVYSGDQLGFTNCSADVSASAPSCTASYSPTTLSAPGTANISWSSSGADKITGSCTGPISVPSQDLSSLSDTVVSIFPANKYGIETCTFVPSRNGVNGTPCSASTNVISAPLSVSCSANPESIAPGQSITWTAHPVGGVGNYAYYWGDSEGSIAQAGQSVSKTYNTIGEKLAVLVITSLGTNSSNPMAITSCSAKVEEQSTTPNDPGTSFTASCSTNPSSVSTDEHFTLTATSTGGTAPYTYSWSDNIGTIGDHSSSLVRSYATAGTKSFSVIINSGGKEAKADCSINVNYPTN